MLKGKRAMASTNPRPRGSTYRPEMDDIERASRDEIIALQIKRLAWSLSHAFPYHSDALSHSFLSTHRSPSRISASADPAFSNTVNMGGNLLTAGILFHFFSPDDKGHPGAPGG